MEPEKNARRHGQNGNYPTTTAFQRLQNDPAGKTRHVHDSHTSNHGRQTPSPEVSQSTKPKRDLSPAVARLATYPQAGLAAIKTSNFRPSRSHPNETDSGSKRYFDLSEMSSSPPSGKEHGPKSVFSLNSARHDDDSSVDLTKSAASAPSHFPASQPQQRQ